MKTATYTGLQNQKIVVEYDEESPCRICGLPVVEASMGGTDVCPWCDCGIHRDGRKWTYQDAIQNRNTQRQHADEKENLREQ